MDRLLYPTQTYITSKDYPQDKITLADNEIIEVIQVDYIKKYQLCIHFNNQVKQVVDFYPFLSSSRNPLIRKYLNIDLFKSYSVEYGDLHWNDYDLCFPIADLYENKLLDETAVNLDKIAQATDLSVEQCLSIL